jgi:dTDP-4-dehydrorhamnose reductase
MNSNDSSRGTPGTSPAVWITGAGGLIGSYLVRAAAQFAPQWCARGLTRDQLELTDYAAVDALFRRERPAVVIHCAALSRTPTCQQKPALARQLNVDVTAHLAGLAADIPFVFFSTDLVFDGRQGHYVETDPAQPLTVYGETKLAAERIVLANPKHTVIRTSLTGGTSPTGDRGFNEEVRRTWQAGQTPVFFIDEFRCPIPAEVTARAVWTLVGQNPGGLYHLVGRERMSRAQIGQLLARRWPQLNPRCALSSLHDYKGPPRAPDTSLNCAKVQARLPFRLPGLTEWLAAHPDERF